MIKVLIATIAVLFAAMSYSYAHAREHTALMPMMFEITPKEKANVVLARLIEESLERDSSGNALIKGSPCATPNSFAEAISTFHPGLGIRGVHGLPMFLRALKWVPSPPGKFRMSAVDVDFSKDGTPEECTLALDRVVREFRPNEGGWLDTNTGRVILAGDCSNVVAPPAVPTTPAPLPRPAAPEAPPVQAAECTDLPEGVGNIVFPDPRDRGAWFNCNPWAECTTDCIEWVSGHGRAADHVKALTGQGTRGAYTALKNVSSVPVLRHGVTVFCSEGTDTYHVLEARSSVPRVATFSLW